MEKLNNQEMMNEKETSFGGSREGGKRNKLPKRTLPAAEPSEIAIQKNGMNCMQQTNAYV